MVSTGRPGSFRQPARAATPRVLFLGDPPGEAWGAAAERVAGVDEAGRGSLAGPVVAAAVILPPGVAIPGLADSKLLRPAARLALAEVIRAVALSYHVAAVEAAEIDATDILRATLAAMVQAVGRLEPRPALVLVDGNVTPRLAMPARAIVSGDRLVPAISAASILAKVARDQTMEAHDHRYPGYGFASHKGYGTALHRERIARYGPSPIHRTSFGGVREHIGAPVQERLW